MSTARLLTQGLRSMARYKLRTGLMLLGSLVGVAALSFVMSVGQGMRVKMVRTVSQIVGDASILVAGGGSRTMGPPRSGAARLTIDDMVAVATEVPGIEAWDPQAELRAPVRYGDASATARVLGSSDRWEHVWSRGVSGGESFSASDVASSARVAVIGETVVRRLFGNEDPIGAEIRLGAVALRVIGVLEPFGNDMHGMDRDNEVVVPISTLMRRLTNVDAINSARLLVKDPAAQEETARNVRRVLRERHAVSEDQPDDFTIVTALEAQQMVSTIQRILLIYLPLVGGIALIVGGVVAAALMLASVKERVGEIGLRGAVGARPQDIHRQFLLETAATVVAGAVAGIVLGYIGSEFVANRLLLESAFSWPAVVVSLVAAAVVGLLAGVAPARRAARLHPAEALRSH